MKTKLIRFHRAASSYGPLSPYIKPYLDQVEAEGFALGSVYEQVCVLKKLGHWLGHSGRTVKSLDERVAADFLLLVIKRRYPKNAGPSTLRRLLALLRRLDVIPAHKATPLNPSQKLVSAFERFLAEQRNLCPQSIVRLVRVAQRFLSEKFGSGQLQLSALSAPDVTAFVKRHALRHGSSNAKSTVAAMRSFLRYLHYADLVAADLSWAVPKVARWALSSLPKHLSATQVRQVLRHCDRSTSRGRRNHAILLLLARLGLRAGEVVQLNLEDIDWDHGRITVCGKGRRAQLPLPADVARAIAGYLQRDRPRCTCRRVFIRDYAPVGGLGRSTSIAKIVQCALAEAGVKSDRKGAHLLRHSLATDMLRKGASLDEIGEVLRHRSPDTTAIYAKVDIRALRSLALPWLGGGR